MNGIKITSFSVIGVESVSYRSHSLVVFQFANVLHLRKYWWSFHTSFPPIRVIYLFIFFSFTPWWSRLRAELWVKQNLRLFNLPHLTTFYCTRLFFNFIAVLVKFRVRKTHKLLQASFTAALPTHHLSDSRFSSVRAVIMCWKDFFSSDGIALPLFTCNMIICPLDLFLFFLLHILMYCLQSCLNPSR